MGAATARPSRHPKPAEGGVLAMKLNNRIDPDKRGAFWTGLAVSTAVSIFGFLRHSGGALWYVWPAGFALVSTYLLWALFTGRMDD